MTEQTATNQSIEQAGEDFTLNAAQMEFMINVDLAAERADQADDYAFFDELVESEKWEALFGTMSWDQAYDRYEIMIGRCVDC